MRRLPRARQDGFGGLPLGEFQLEARRDAQTYDTGPLGTRRAPVTSPWSGVRPLMSGASRQPPVRARLNPPGRFPRTAPAAAADTSPPRSGKPHRASVNQASGETCAPDPDLAARAVFPPTAPCPRLCCRDRRFATTSPCPRVERVASELWPPRAIPDPRAPRERHRRLSPIGEPCRHAAGPSSRSRSGKAPFAKSWPAPPGRPGPSLSCNEAASPSARIPRPDPASLPRQQVLEFAPSRRPPFPHTVESTFHELRPWTLEPASARDPCAQPQGASPPILRRCGTPHFRHPTGGIAPGRGTTSR